MTDYITVRNYRKGTAGIVDFIYNGRKGTQKVELLDIKYRKRGQGRNNEFYLLRQNKITQNKTTCFKSSIARAI